MTKFEMKKQIEDWIKNKELIQIHHSENTQDYDVCYLLHFEGRYLTFAILGTTGIYEGIVLRNIENINLFKDKAIYLSEFAKKITNDEIYQRAVKDLTGIKSFMPRGFFSAFKGKKTIIGVQYDSDESFGGRIVDFDENYLVLDEYSCDIDGCFSRVYLRLDRIVKLQLSADWLNTITRALADKNI